MKIAIIHNYLEGVGGAERVGLTLANELNADFYTTNINENVLKNLNFDVNIKSIGRIPSWPLLRQQVCLNKFKKLDLNQDYDFFIIEGDWAMTAAVHNRPNIWYAHSPLREIWDLYDYVKNEVIPPYARIPFSLWARYNRMMDKKHVKYVGTIISNSEHTRAKIKQFLGRDSRVIYPPIETTKYHYKKNGDFWLSVNRIIPPKRIELQLEAFKKLPQEKLYIVGPLVPSIKQKVYYNDIKRIMPANVTLLDTVSFNQLTDLYANCKGFITTARDEDFGMTPVEAMASGKPVIVPDEGGYKESVIQNVTGKLIHNIDAEKIVCAVEEISSNPAQYKDACLQQAKKFDTSIFIRKIKSVIELSSKQ